MFFDFEGACHLLAAVVKRAIQDARKGQTDAIEFLNSFLEGWQRYVED